jgi:hypothetical protein
MIYLFFDRREGGLDLHEVEHPAEMPIHRTADMHLDLKAVSMHSSVLVARRDIWQPVRSLNAELFEYLHMCPTESPGTCVFAGSAAISDDPCNSARPIRY